MVRFSRFLKESPAIFRKKKVKRGSKICSEEILVFKYTRQISVAVMWVTPSLPKEEEAAQGEHPLTPDLSFNLLLGIAIARCLNGGAEKECWSPKSGCQLD
jgi:hypothetical protein